MHVISLYLVTSVTSVFVSLDMLSAFDVLHRSMFQVVTMQFYGIVMVYAVVLIITNWIEESD